MAGAGQLRVEGAAQLRRTLKSAERGVQDLKDAHKRAAEIVAREAENTAPTGPAPGHIKDTIRATGSAAEATVRVGNNRKGRAGVRYAKSLHWGHKPHAVTASPEKVPAQPWVTTAASSTEGRWLPVYVDQLQTICDSVEGTTTP